MCLRINLNYAGVISRFSSLFYFLAAFKILGQLCHCFWSFECSFFTVICHLLHVLDYVTCRLNSSYVCSLSLHVQLAEYYSQQPVLSRHGHVKLDFYDQF